MRSGSGEGSGRSSTPSTTLKIAALAPMPSARVRRTTAVKPGVRASPRRERRRSRSRVFTVILSAERRGSVRRRSAAPLTTRSRGGGGPGAGGARGRGRASPRRRGGGTRRGRVGAGGGRAARRGRSRRAERCEDPLPLPEPHQRPEPRALGGPHPPAEWREAVVDPALVLLSGGRLRLGHEPGVGEPADVAVEAPGLERDLSAGVVEDVLAEAVAVAAAAGEHGEEERLHRAEGEEGARVVLRVSGGHGRVPAPEKV